MRPSATKRSTAARFSVGQDFRANLVDPEPACDRFRSSPAVARQHDDAAGRRRAARAGRPESIP
jgi:hypothetical protein